MLRALKEGVKLFGKFESTYNDNGSSEKSAVADYTIEQLQMYGMKFLDEGEMYRTENGAYVVEDTDGKTVSVVKSRTEWKKQNRRIFANVKNAKTKPVERFFSTLEQLLLDRCLPGYVPDIKGGAAEEEESNRRLEWQKRSGYILNIEEFARQVIAAVNTYINRVHGTLKRSPLKELEFAVKEEGWQPSLIDPQDLHYLFMERAYATVRGDRVTLNGKQYIGPDLTQDMLRTNRGNLVGLNRKKIELRYDPDDQDSGVWAIDPRSDQAIFLTPITPVSMLDNEAASAALELKRRNMKAVKDAYRSITADVPVLFDPEKFKELNESRAAALASGTESSPGLLSGTVSVSTPEKPAMSDDEFRSLVAAKITVEPNIRERAKHVYLTERDRYEALYEKQLKNERITAADLEFMADYEEKMSDGETDYFTSFAVQNKTLRRSL